jgi:hypothetical protein
MAIKDNKGISSLIVAKMGAKPEKAEQPEMEKDDNMALEIAGEELIKAIESKSAMAVVDAIKSLMEMCSESEPEIEIEEEQP